MVSQLCLMSVDSGYNGGGGDGGGGVTPWWKGWTGHSVSCASLLFS